MQNNLTMGNVYSDSYASNQTKITVSQLVYPQSEQFTNTAQKHRSHNHITGQDNNNVNGNKRNNDNNREMRSHASSDQILNGTGEGLSKLVPASHIRKKIKKKTKEEKEMHRLILKIASKLGTICGLPHEVLKYQMSRAYCGTDNNIMNSHSKSIPSHAFYWVMKMDLKTKRLKQHILIKISKHNNNNNNHNNSNNHYHSTRNNSNSYNI